MILMFAAIADPVQLRQVAVQHDLNAADRLDSPLNLQLPIGDLNQFLLHVLLSFALVVRHGGLSQKQRKPWLQHRCNIVALSLQNPRTANIISKATQAMVTVTLLFRYIFVTIIRPTSRPAVKSRPTRRHSAQIPPRPLLPSAGAIGQKLVIELRHWKGSVRRPLRPDRSPVRSPHGEARACRSRRQPQARGPGGCRRKQRSSSRPRKRT